MDVDRWDALLAAGLTLIGVGLWLLRPWLALVVVGALLVGVGLAGARAAAADGERS